MAETDDDKKGWLTQILDDFLNKVKNAKNEDKAELKADEVSEAKEKLQDEQVPAEEETSDLETRIKTIEDKLVIIEEILSDMQGTEATEEMSKNETKEVKMKKNDEVINLKKALINKAIKKGVITLEMQPFLLELSAERIVEFIELNSNKIINKSEKDKQMIDDRTQEEKERAEFIEEGKKALFSFRKGTNLIKNKEEK